MNPGLGADYELLAAVAQVVQVLAWIAILVGAFLRESGTREYLSKGAEGLGWVALIGSGIVGSQIAAQQALDCSLWGRDCIETDAQAWASGNTCSKASSTTRSSAASPSSLDGPRPGYERGGRPPDHDA
ncbi:hypothetical protein [Ornithinimicrobium murale]|uniref:hypothetical protein n=1 Tax=Ornithinimicrobium murale TaxID=1050153 RepID=UPI000E0D95EE|nr:hypothetical protein [Ornithinimicrobium murale]